MNWDEFLIMGGKLKHLYIGYTRYEKIRKLNPQQFGELYEKCLEDHLKFDDEVDRLILKGKGVV